MGPAWAHPLGLGSVWWVSWHTKNFQLVKPLRIPHVFGNSDTCFQDVWFHEKHASLLESRRCCSEWACLRLHRTICLRFASKIHLTQMLLFCFAGGVLRCPKDNYHCWCFHAPVFCWQIVMFTLQLQAEIWLNRHQKQHTLMALSGFVCLAVCFYLSMTAFGQTYTEYLNESK